MSHGAFVAVRELLALGPALIAPRRSRTAIEQSADRGVRRMFEYARSTIPYYADPRYDVTVRSVADLTQLPVLDKQTLRDLGPEPFQAADIGWFQTDQTSGSTGRVVRVRHDAAAYGYHGATVVRRFLSSGYRPWWKIAQIKPFPRPHRWFQSLGLFRRTVVPSSRPESEIKRQVLELEPQLVMGYPVMLRALLRSLSTDELATLRRSLRLVFTDSELLPPDERLALAERFGVPVCDEYSAYEVLTMGSHCRYGAMHVDEDRIVLEVLDDTDQPTPPGQEGAVVVTHFRERAMPLLRYRVGDRAILRPPGCPCGSRFRILELTSGRTEDYVQVPGGRRIYLPAFIGMGITLPGFTEFMIRQSSDGTITVHLVPDPTAGMPFDDVAAGFAAAMADYGIPDGGLEFVAAERLDLTAGGKARLIASDYRPGRADDVPADADR